MHKIRFSIAIRAPREKIWQLMLNDKTYRQWASAFQEGSYAVTDWKEGNKALFLTPSGDGMLSQILTNRPHEFLSIKHLGVVKKGVEMRDTDEAKSWAGALENYTLRESDDGSTLTIEMDVNDENKTYFEETWPKALRRLKEIAEKRSRN